MRGLSLIVPLTTADRNPDQTLTATLTTILTVTLTVTNLDPVQELRKFVAHKQEAIHHANAMMSSYTRVRPRVKSPRATAGVSRATQRVHTADPQQWGTQVRKRANGLVDATQI